MKKIFLFAFVLLRYGIVSAQQVPHTEFSFRPASPAYPDKNGPLVLIDEGHYNFHTLDGRYRVFANILEADGYQLKAHTGHFSANSLKGASILVIANAIHKSNQRYEQWHVPNPSAFTKTEIATLKEWVSHGGSLFFIADHMPFPGAGKELAEAFGFEFLNGFATDTTTGLFPGKKKELDLFQASRRTLARHPITEGSNQLEQVDQVATFTGQAFRIPTAAHSLLTFDKRYKILFPDTAWLFGQHTPRIPIDGWSQGAVLTYGQGKVAVFGEAAMFTAQLKGPDKIPFGLNSPDATQNAQFLINLVHWLDGKRDVSKAKLRDTKKDTISISGTRFLFPLFQQWAQAYQYDHPETHFEITAKLERPTLRATAAPIQRGTLPPGKVATTATRFAILPVINADHPLADSLLRYGFSKEQLATVYFKSAGLDNHDLDHIATHQQPLHVYSRQACAAVSFAAHLNRDVKDIVHHGNTIENDDLLLETVLNDRLGLAFLDLAGMYDLQTRKVKKGIRVVPIDLNNDGVISSNENFYDSLDTLLSRLENKQIASIIPVGDVTILYNNNVDQGVRSFIDWIRLKGQRFVRQEGYLDYHTGAQQPRIVANTP